VQVAPQTPPTKDKVLSFTTGVSKPKRRRLHDRIRERAIKQSRLAKRRAADIKVGAIGVRCGTPNARAVVFPPFRSSDFTSIAGPWSAQNPQRRYSL